MSAGGTSQATGEDLRLEVVSGKASGFVILVGERLVIGRHSEGPGRLADDPELSRHHAQISRDDRGTYLIEDLASTNGTIVNGYRISSPTALATGDSIEVGATTMRVADAPATSEPPPDVDVRAATVTVDTPAEMRAPPPPPIESGPPTEPQRPSGAADIAAPATEPQEPSEAADIAAPATEPQEPSEAADIAAPPTEPQEPPETADIAAPPVDAAPLTLQLVFDPQSAEVEIRLDDASEPIHLALTQGHWQVRAR
jgi:FHA domain